MSDRQPISTAPMDGTRVLLFHELDAQESDRFPTVGSYGDDRWIMNRIFVIERSGRLFAAFTPKHWAPLNDNVVEFSP